MRAHPARRSTPCCTSLAVLLLAAVSLLLSSTAQAAPAQVTVAGSMQSEAGCPADWDPACATTHLTYDAGDDVWQGTWTIPAGSYEYKAALNDGWAENYGLGAIPGGANIPLNLAASGPVKFYYDDKTHWITDNASSVIATVAGSFQSEMGCAADWDPGCLRSWLEDPDGNGIYTFTTNAIPAGSFDAKVAINESWDVNYGAGGVPGGSNISFTVGAAGDWTTFSFDATTHVLTVTVLGTPPPGSANVTVAGSMQSEAGCPGDWDPTCATTHLAFESGDGIWQGTWTLPAGSYEYKAALDDSWTVNYGLHATRDGANIPFSLGTAAPVKFYYDPLTHWITDNVSSVIATAVGSFQSEAGCAADWDPTCLRSWLEDPDGDGTYSYIAQSIPPGSYEAKVAINEAWDVNYGAGGVQGGANIPFTVPPQGSAVIFNYNSATHVLTISLNNPVPTTKTSWGRLKAIYR